MSLLLVILMLISLSLFLCFLFLNYHNEYNKSLKGPSQLSRRFRPSYYLNILSPRDSCVAQACPALLNVKEKIVTQDSELLYYVCRD